MAEQTILDFDDQWARYTDNSGFYGSQELFKDIVSPLVDVASIEGAVVVDIGSGTGRIVSMLYRAGAGRIYAVEPAGGAYIALVENTQDMRDRIVCMNHAGDEVPSGLDADYIFSIGVVHHIPQPGPVLDAAYKALKPGGKCFLWLYGKEGNEFYCAMSGFLRKITTRSPHAILAMISYALTPLLSVYIWLSEFIALPLRDYCLRVIGPMSWAKRYLVIYDQLNPEYAKYYTQEEARELMEGAGFTDVLLHHRHGYSWSVIGTRK